MEIQNNYEPEMGLKDLLFTVLYKWRSIVLMAILFGVLLGGAKFAKRLINMQDQETQMEAQEDYEDALSLYETNKETYEREIENITLKIETFNDYMNNSPLMQISPYSKPVATADLYVKTDYEIMPGMMFQNVDYTDSLVKAYAIAINQGELLDGIDRYISTLDDTYLAELVTGKADYDNNMVHIEVTYSDLDIAEKMLTKVLNNIERRSIDTTAKIGPHQIEVTNRGTAMEVDEELAKRQSDNVNTQSSLQKVLADKKAELKVLKEPKLTALSKKAALKSGIKYGILGGVFGAFIVILFACISFLMSDKVFSERELHTRFKIKPLGVFAIERKKRILSGIDQWLDRLNGGDNVSDKATTFQIISTNIENYTKADQCLLVVGTAEAAHLQDIVTHLKGSLTERTIVYGGNLITDVSALQKLPFCDEIILVERRGYSNYSDIEREIETVESLHKAIIGYVLL